MCCLHETKQNGAVHTGMYATECSVYKTLKSVRTGVVDCTCTCSLCAIALLDWSLRQSMLRNDTRHTGMFSQPNKAGTVQDACLYIYTRLYVHMCLFVHKHILQGARQVGMNIHAVYHILSMLYLEIILTLSGKVHYRIMNFPEWKSVL